MRKPIRFMPAVLAAAALCWLAAPALAVAKAKPEVGIDEHLGQTVPMDLTFRPKRQAVRLGDLSTARGRRAGVLQLPGHLRRSHRSFEAVSMVKDTRQGYRVITISFRPGDTPKLAAEKEAQYCTW